MTAYNLTKQIEGAYTDAKVVQIFDVEHLSGWDCDQVVAVIERTTKSAGTQRALVGTDHGRFTVIKKVEQFLSEVQVMDYTGRKIKVVDKSAITSLLA